MWKSVSALHMYQKNFLKFKYNLITFAIVESIRAEYEGRIFQYEEGRCGEYFRDAQEVLDAKMEEIISLNKKVDELTKFKEGKITYSNQGGQAEFDKILRAKELIDSMRKKMDQINQLTEEKKVKWEIENTQEIEFKKHIGKLYLKKKQLVPKLEKLKFYNFKLSRACNELSISFSGKNGKENKSVNRGSKKLNTYRSEKLLNQTSLSKSKSVKRLFGKKSRET
jgi:hypothetical protein